MMSPMQVLADRTRQANKLLLPFAVPHGIGLGREYKEAGDATRFPFQRDRDRIIHTEAFRRLKGKTQVFISSAGDHYRTRLTHTMEVAQISRDMARTLGLNEDLAECIALAHDLGHTPFGHAGEDAMRTEMQRHGSSFEHNLQSLRIVTLLAERTTKYKGLNLNIEVLEGLMKHRTSYDEEHGKDLPRSPSLEAQVVNLADEIAYTAHDIDDGLRAGILSEGQFVQAPLFVRAYQNAHKSGTEVRGGIIHLLVMDAYAETDKRLQENTIQSLEDVYSATESLVSFSQEMKTKLNQLRDILFSELYKSDAVLEYSNEGMETIRTLFQQYESAPPAKVFELQQKTGSTLPEAIKDYIAGMTDEYALEKAKLCHPEPVEG